MKTIDKSIKITLNTPTNLDFTIFGSLNNSKNLHKIIYLIHQINHYTYKNGKFSMFKKTWYEFLGCSPNDLNSYLSKLMAAGLIIQTQVGNNLTKKLSEYEFVEPFEPETGRHHNYYPNDHECPIFIKRWVADNYKLNSPKSSKHTKSINVKTVKSNTDNIALIHALRRENNELQQIILAYNNSALDVLKSLDEPTTITSFVDEKRDDIPVVRELEVFGEKVVIQNWDEAFRNVGYKLEDYILNGSLNHHTDYQLKQQEYDFRDDPFKTYYKIIINPVA